jgi:hypothetical protein
MTVWLQFCPGAEHQKYGQLSQLSISYSYDSPGAEHQKYGQLSQLSISYSYDSIRQAV